jgi:hypothetical protein
VYLRKLFRCGGCRVVGKVNWGKLNRKKCSQGFSMPVAMGTGLIMLIVGQTLIVRSYNDRVASLGQVAGNGAVGVAEIGLTRYQAFLNRNRELAFLDACVPASSTSTCSRDTWRNAVTSTKLANKVCPASSPELRTQRLQAMAAQDTAAWQDIDSTNPRQGQFRLVSYTVNDPSHPTAGNLVVEGRLGQEGSGATAVADGDTAAARLQVTIPLTGGRLGQPATYPGIWLTTLNTSTTSPSTFSSGTTSVSSPSPIALDVRANVFVSDCGANLSAIRVDPSTQQNHMVMQTDMPMPSLPPLPVAMPNPGQTPAPNTSPSPSNDNSNSSDRPRAYELGTISTGLSLPRPEDVPVMEDSSTPNGAPTQVFRYLVDKIDLTKVSDNVSLGADTTPRELYGRYYPVRVELYLRGDLVNDSRIHNVCNTPRDTTDNMICEPTNFRIYAYKYATEAPENGVYPSFCFPSNHSLNALIFAPGYQIGTRGSARLKGTLWARSWDLSCGATAGQIMLSQSGGWGNQKVTLPPQLGAIQQWQRQESSQ